MSAIIGIVQRQGSPVGLSHHLQHALSALAAYGPEGSQCWIGERVGLGHQRLVITPEDALERLPWYDAASGLAITADVRLDNREDVSAALGIPPPERAWLPDSALILRAYQKWGQACPTHLLGDFAFAIVVERITMEPNRQPQDHLRSRVLVADDEASIRAMLTHFLEQEHFEVQTAQDGPAALHAFDTEHFDIILVDWHMPGMNGLDMAAVVRQQNPAIPIALITAMASTLDPEAVIRAGISQVFAKPFDLKELASWLKSVRAR